MKIERKEFDDLSDQVERNWNWLRRLEKEKEISLEVRKKLNEENCFEDMIDLTLDAIGDINKKIILLSKELGITIVEREENEEKFKVVKTEEFKTNIIDKAQ